MQENEFEKQVKQKMGEFRLRPSDPVWLEIRKELLRKKRRRMLLFLPLAALLLAGGYFTWQSVSPEKQLHLSANKVAAKNENDNKTKQSVDNDNKTNDLVKKTEGKNDIIDRVVNKKDKTTDEKKSEEIKSNKDIAPVKTKDVENYKLKESKGTTLAGTDASGIKIEHKDQSDFFLQAGKKKSVNKVRKGDFAETGDATVSNIDKRKINKPRSLNNNGNEQLQNESSSFEPGIISDIRSSIDNTPVSLTAGIQQQIVSDSIFRNRLMNVEVPAIKTGNFNIQRALKIGFTFAIGASSRANKPLEIISSSSAEKNLPSSLGVGGVGQGSYSGGVLILPPSEVKAGVAFKAGITVAKSLSKRFDISTGLLYSYSSDHIQVGKSLNYSLSYSSNFLNYNLDVRNQSSYANVQNTNYTNKYHFIELPVSVSYNLTRKWRAPLTWNAGVSVSRLISTNTLLYDAAWGGVYYDGKNDINKTQFNISTGFSLRINGHNGWQWNIGPQIYVSASKLFNNAFDENKHPVYGGLHMQVFLPSKKKSK